jgi:competence protein ComEC
MIDMIQYFSHFAWASFWTVTPNIFEIMLFYCLIFFLFFIKRLSYAKIGLLFVIILATADISYWVYQTRFNKHLKVTYLDVGQGNSALIQFPGKERMLIDGGGFQTGSFDTGQMLVAPFLFHQKILKVDYLVLSHPHADHMNGLVFIASHFKPKELWRNRDVVTSPVYEDLMNIVESENIKTYYPSDLGINREISGVKIELLHPSPSEHTIESPNDGEYLNNNSLVLKLSYRGKSFLFPGDIEMEAENDLLLKAGPKLKSDVFLVPHHGSKNSSTSSFLSMVKPEISVISSGKGNSFGLPHGAVLVRLRNADSKIIRIDKVGAVQVTAEEDGFRINNGHSLTRFFF